MSSGLEDGLDQEQSHSRMWCHDSGTRSLLAGTKNERMSDSGS